jgi:ABC-type Na+ transport system ATPase subunit NatA
VTVAGSDRALVCTGLVKRYGEHTAVDGVGFAIAAGETYGLLGPNGAGKTTTIAMLCGVLDRDSGMITIGGAPLDGAGSPAKRCIGFVPQDVALYAPLSARENLRFFGGLYGLHGSTLRDRVEYARGAVGLTDRGDDQSVIALAAEGTAVLYTTHYMEETQRLCDRVGMPPRTERSRAADSTAGNYTASIRPAATAAASAASSCCSTISRPPSQKPGSARSTPTMLPNSSGDWEPPRRSSSR